MSARLSALCLPLLLAACSSTGGAPAEPEEMDPEQRFALFKETALFHYDNDDMSRAEAQALKALEIHPDDEDLKLLVGWAAMRRGTPEDMIHAHGIFSSLEDTDDFRAWLGLATAKERLGQGYAEAADDFAAGERISEDPEEDVVALVAELDGKATGHWHEAIALYQRVLGTHPDERLALNGQQRVFFHLGEVDAAVEVSEQLIAQMGAELDYFRTQLRREDLTVEEEDRHRRNERQAVEVARATSLTVATALRAADRTPEAIAWLDRVLQGDAEDAEALALRGQFHTEEGLWAEAIEDLDAFLRVSSLDWNHPDVQRAYELRTKCERGLRAQPAD